MIIISTPRSYTTYTPLLKPPDDFRTHSKTNTATLIGLLSLGFRNRLVHGYLSVNMDIVWRVVERDLPPLKNAVIKMLDHLTDDE